MSNVRAHCRMMVVESCQGMLVGALLERMGGLRFIMFLLQRTFKHDLTAITPLSEETLTFLKGLKNRSFIFLFILQEEEP